MSSLESLKGEHLLTRHIDINSYDAGEGRVLVEGALHDNRHVNVHTEDGRCLRPGPVHGMTVRLLVGGLPPQILDAEAEMPQTPRKQCPDTASSVKRLIGLDLSQGFSKESIKRLGGTKGCLHILKLVLAMATPALHGWASNRYRHPDNVNHGSSTFLERVKNSCQVWSEDSKVYQEVARKLSDLRNESHDLPSKRDPSF